MALKACWTCSASMLMTSDGVDSGLLWLLGSRSTHVYWCVSGFVCTYWECCFVYRSMDLWGVAVAWYLGGCVISCKIMSWCCNRRVLGVAQTSLFINPDTLDLRRWSFSINVAALLWIVVKCFNCILCTWISSTVICSSFDLTNSCRLFLCVLQGGECV